MAGCSKTEATVETSKNNDAITNETTAEEQPAENISSEEASFSFTQFEHLEFLFASGAGAWGTILTIEDDGSFSGQYSDSDIGSNAAEYPHGTLL